MVRISEIHFASRSCLRVTNTFALAMSFLHLWNIRIMMELRLKSQLRNCKSLHFKHFEITPVKNISLSYSFGSHLVNGGKCMDRQHQTPYAHGHALIKLDALIDAVAAIVAAMTVDLSIIVRNSSMNSYSSVQSLLFSI